MKVTKFQHSCLLIEENGKVILIDPGSFSNIKIGDLKQLDYLLITHNHQDHMHLPIIKEAAEKFGNLKIIGPSTVREDLGKEGLIVEAEGDDIVEITNAPHHKMLDHQTDNFLFTVFNKISHPGDSFEFSKTAEILALPITAPWGSTQEALELALKLKPKTVIPIHDFLYKDEVRPWMYQMSKGFLEKEGINFIEIQDGQPIDL
jgi:L-ascorbate metabolism protein UlaG (beta-lactamase superfamily)